MKKRRIIFIICLFCFGFCACNNSENFEAPANFYYVQAQDSLDLSKSVICAEVRETKSYGSDLDKLMRAYLLGPLSDRCSSPFPDEIQIVSVIKDEDKVVITLNDSFSELDGLDFTVSATCISMTLFELVECDLVELRTEGKLANGKDSIVLSRDLLYLTDHSHEII